MSTEATCDPYHLVEIKRLLGSANVLKNPPWGVPCHPEIFLNKVKGYIRSGDVLDTPVDSSNTNRNALLNDHARRCAYFATQPNYDPVHIDVGIPDVCYVRWILDDGNHRLYGRYVAGDKHIRAVVSGSVEHARQRLGVNI